MLPGRSPVARGEARRHEQHDADEPDGQPDDAVEADRFVGQEHRRDDDHEQRHGELRIAASALSTDCSAQVMSANGIVMLMMAITTRWP